MVPVQVWTMYCDGKVYQEFAEDSINMDDWFPFLPPWSTLQLSVGEIHGGQKNSSSRWKKEIESSLDISINPLFKVL